MLVYLLSICDEETKPTVSDFYHKYHKELTRFITNELNNAGDTNYITDAQDVVQNTFVKITRYISKFPDIDPAKQKAYLYAIARNEIRDFLAEYRKYTSESVELGDVPADTDFIASLDVRDRFKEVVSAIYTLEERYSTVLLFRYAENFSVKKIADLLGVKQAVVYARLSKGKMLLIEKMNKLR